MSFIIDDDVLEQIRSQADIVDLISEYVNLKKSGSNYLGLCPFHNEKTASFSVSQSKGIFKCFGCGAGGDQISFIMKKENLPFREAVEFLADKYNIELREYEDKNAKDKKHLKERIYEANKAAALFYMQSLNRSKSGFYYLKKREIDEHTILNFALGYAPDSWDDLYKELKSKGFSDEELEQANLISKSKRGNYIDRFRNRIMFPIVDSQKRVIAFGGRIMDNSMPKYLNSSDTPVFNKGEHLYNLNKIKEESSDKIVLVEGYMDVISLYKSGIHYSVASLGTAFTENQAKLIKRYAKEVYICYDSDSAGIKATDRAIDILIMQDIKPKIVRLENGMDPDDFVKKYGKLSFELELSKAVMYLDYKIEKIRQKYNLASSEGVVGFTTEVSELLMRLKNPIERDVYIEKVSRQFGINKESISSYINLKSRDLKKSFEKKKVNLEKKTVKVETVSVKRAQANKEKQLIAYIVNSKSLFDIVNERLESYEFSSMRERDVFEMVKDYYSTHESFDVKSSLEGPISPEYLMELSRFNLDTKNDRTTVEELIKSIKHFNLEDRREKLLNKIKLVDQNKQDVRELNGLIEELNEVNIKLNLPS